MNGNRKASMPEPKGSAVSFHHIDYGVQIKGACCKSSEKRILRDVSGIFKPGVNAIMGPTGSGKSSMLDVLAGRKDPEGLSGNVLIDGKKQPSNFKCISGYVVQDDVIVGTLTVKENFMFSANLRLPKSVGQTDKETWVDETIVELGLSHCADSKVGNEFIRGVSGGERKRTNIGMELIISPTVLFLDEPTTGLDASTANAVMILLHRLSRKGRTIIVSIHQPRYSIFKLFDRLMLLARGRTVYHGPAEDAIHFFNELGYECEAYNNPPDFFLDVINGDSSAVMSTAKQDTLGFANQAFKDDEVTVHMSNEGENNAVVAMKAPDKSETSLAEKLAALYKKTKWFQDLHGEIDPIFDEFTQKKGSREEESGIVPDYPTSFCTQLNWVSRRAVLNIIRNPQTSVMQFGVSIIFAILVGIIFLRLDNTIENGIQNRVGCFFFIVMNQVFSNLSAVELFIKERKIFIHENVSGFYRVSVYFFAKVFCDLLPMRLIPVIIFSVVAYFMTGLTVDVGKFFFFVLNLFLTTLSACGLGFLVSASVRVFAIANLAIALIYVLMMVFSGLLVNLNTVGEWLRWLQYFSIFRYSMNALAVNELKDLEFCAYLPDGNPQYCNSTVGNIYLEGQGIPYISLWDKWQNEVALGCIAFGFLVLTYVRLRTLNKFT